MTESECCICLEQIREPYQTECHHIFHHDCLYRWNLKNLECPKCRSRLTVPPPQPDNKLVNEYFYNFCGTLDDNRIVLYLSNDKWPRIMEDYIVTHTTNVKSGCICNTTISRYSLFDKYFDFRLRAKYIVTKSMIYLELPEQPVIINNLAILSKLFGECLIVSHNDCYLVPLHINKNSVFYINTRQRLINMIPNKGTADVLFNPLTISSQLELHLSKLIIPSGRIRIEHDQHVLA